MLNIFTNRKDISNMLIVDLNDFYFETCTLKNDEFTKLVLNDIDYADYFDENNYTSKRKGVCNLHKSSLSTGTKTLLNIYYNPDVCFNMRECGNNVFKYLPLIQDGNILWEYPVAFGSGYIDKCYVSVHGEKFSSWIELITYLRMCVSK